MQNLSEIARSFLDRHFAEIVRNEDGSLCEEMSPRTWPATNAIIADLEKRLSISDIPSNGFPHDRLSEWLLSATLATRQEADLSIDIPAGGVHFVPGRYRIFYDFKNTDMVLDELVAAHIELNGALLDFGCSSGRNLAVLRRAFGEHLKLFGADPAQSSIDWLNQNVQGITGVVSQQNPPLPFQNGQFDLIIAKSIWTHFSPAAGRRWFAEMNRVLKPGGNFVFSTHGPHDVASRILLNVPAPRYQNYRGHENWTREEFLSDLVQKYDEEGHYFQAFKDSSYQSDLSKIEGAETGDWGLLFVSPEFLESMLPEEMVIVRRIVGRTGNRHDLYIVQRSITAAP